MTYASGSQLASLAALSTVPPAHTSLTALLAAYAPPSPEFAWVTQDAMLAATSGGTHNVIAETSDVALLVAYKTGVQGATIQQTWTFVLDGHRFWVLPLGAEGTWAYDTITRQWCHLYTQGYSGLLNFSYGTMWNLRIVGTDILNNTLYELDPEQTLDEGWRPIQRVATGGLQVRSSQAIGCANFRLTASNEDITDSSVSLSFSDDNGVSWGKTYTQTLPAGLAGAQLLFSALGSFAAPGRIFQVADTGGRVRIDGADAALNNYLDDKGE